MGNKRYSIVRVDNNCPFYTELVTTKCWIYKNNKSCFKCKIKKNYGDTKEQLIRKVAQKIFENKNRDWVNAFGEEYLLKKYINMNREESLKLSKEIVEFLGVE